MVDVNVLKNAVKFLERTDVTGLECYTWCDTHTKLVMAIQASDAGALSVPAPVVENK